jgi:hypothetical protein
MSSGAGYPEGSLEMDFYAGYKTRVGDVGLDMGALYYHYPDAAGKRLCWRQSTPPGQGRQRRGQ